VIRVLRVIGDFVTAPLAKPHSVVQDALVSSWVAVKLGVMRGQIDPGAPIYVGELQPGRGRGYMTVRSVLKTVEDGWAHWDRKATVWWCQVLEQANRDLSPKP
jgi:hypothetical protein